MLKRVWQSASNRRPSAFIRFLIFASVFACASGAAAQYRFDRWTTDDGLPQNSVYAMAQTDDGYIWLTTFEGLVRFDGIRFTIFNKFNSKNLSTSRFVSLHVEDSETLWLGTETSDLIRFHRGEFQTFKLDKDLPTTDVLKIEKQADGSLLLETGNGRASLAADGQFTYDRATKRAGGKKYFARSGARWEINERNLLAVKDGQTAIYDLPFRRAVETSNNPTRLVERAQMYEDRRGAFWLAQEGFLYRYENGAFKSYGEKDGMPPSLVRAIGEDASGNIWVGTTENGACRLKDERFSCFTAKDGLSSSNVTAVLSDREGTLWFGTNEGGINRLTHQVVSPLSVADGLIDKNVYPLLPVGDDEIWIGTFSSLARYKNGVFTNYSPQRDYSPQRNYTQQRDRLIYYVVQALLEDKSGKLWIGGVGGVQYFENGKFTDFTGQLGLRIGETDFWDIHESRSGALWFAARGGLIKFENDAPTRYTVADGLPDNNVNVIHEAGDGSFWVGTAGGAAHLTPAPFAIQTVYTGKPEAPLTSVRAIKEEADGTFWFGTYDGGLWRLKNEKLTNITTANGLSSNGAFAIVEDDQDNFWMSSNQGIYRVSKQQLNDFADGRISAVTSTAFGKSDGMLNVECNGGRQPGAFKTAEGKIWFPTQDGVAIVDPKIVPFNPNPPPVVIESVKINNQESTDFQTAIELQPSQNNLEIQYTGLSFIKPEQIRFRYRLAGLDADWTEAGARRTAYFPYLPPGNYTFQVAAANSDNVWNEQGATIEIRVLPPFYRTWWFAALTILSISAIGFLFYRRRIAQLERRRRAQEDFSRRLINAHETERRRIAAELHDSIGQSLAMIKNRAVFGAQSATDPNAREQLETITAQTAQTIGEVREISYNLRPYLLERLGLTKAIKSLVNKIADTNHLEISAVIDDVDRLFENEAEMSVYRIIQESLSNVVKHAEANEVKVFVKKDTRLLTISVEDDGKGFDQNAPRGGDQTKGGFGLLGLTERVRMLGGSQTIESAIGNGTRITVRIPLREAGAENFDGKTN